MVLIGSASKKYPGETHYGFVSNNPIIYADKDGKDKILTVTIIGKDGHTTQFQRTDKSYFSYHKNGRYGGAGYYYFKADVHQSLTIDLRNNSASFTSRVDFVNTKSVSTYEYSKLSDAINWVDQTLFGDGDNSDKIQYGFKIYGNGKTMDWQNGLPTAAPGSESIDLGVWLDMVSGLRDGASLPDIMETFGKDKKLAEAWNRIYAVTEAVEKSVEATEALSNENNSSISSNSSANSDSASCPTCKNKEDSTHIDRVNGTGTFQKLKTAGNKTPPKKTQ